MPNGNFTPGDVPYASDANTIARTPSTSFGRNRLNDANAAAAQDALDLVPGTDVQAQDAKLQSIADIPILATDALLIADGSDSFAQLPPSDGFFRWKTGVGWIFVGFGSTSGTVCEGSDSRLSDARTPTSHAASHRPGGSDEVFEQGSLIPNADGSLGSATDTVNLILAYLRDQGFIAT